MMMMMCNWCIIAAFFVLYSLASLNIVYASNPVLVRAIVYHTLNYLPNYTRNLSQHFSSYLQVTCGSTIKLENQKTKHFLHTHEVHYGGGRGSGQQSVTGFPERNSGLDLWIVRGPWEGDYCIQGTPIKKGTVLRLQHGASRKWLHSHPFFSPLSNMQEVSCFGSLQESNEEDNWIVEWDGKEEYWQQDTNVRFMHKVSESYLANHDVQYQRPIPGHTEVFANRFQSKKDDVMMFRATEGVFFPTNSRNLS